jgi:hypothetical protein
MNQLKLGHGDTVCFIINDLLNRELIRRDFKFISPEMDHREDEEESEAGELNDSDTDETC